MYALIIMIFAPCACNCYNYCKTMFCL